MPITKSIAEYGTIHPQPQGVTPPSDTLTQVYLPARSFEHFKRFVTENTDNSIEVERAFSYHSRRSQEYIKVKNYVGLIETRDGTRIEILPKIYRSHTSESSTQAVRDTRTTFLKMLRCLRDSPFVTIGEAHIRSQHFPILEVFITAFCQALDRLVQKGIQKNYVPQTANEPFLKGKWLFQQHLRHNIVRQDRFYVQYDHFQANIPHNRLIKSCLLFLKKVAQSINNQNHIRRFLFVFEDVPPSNFFKKDFAATRTGSRLFHHYRQVMQWVEVFLMRQSFTNFKGKHLNRALLFPMERIFEDYVGYGFKKYLASNYQVHCQHKKYHLVEEHIDKPKFRLIPDLVVQSADFLGILDTKWKLLDSHSPQKNYQIAQQDMYQLYAYGENYDCQNECPQLFLIYPAQEFFKKPLPLFHYNERLKMQAVPFDVANDLKVEIENFKKRYFFTSPPSPLS